MPMVGGQKFPYTPAGKKKAAKAARKLGKKMVEMPKKDSNMGSKKKMAPKKQLGKYGKIGRV